MKRNRRTSVQDIANHFSVSRPVISQYLNERPSKDFTMRIDFRWKDKTCDVLRRAFGVNEHPTWNDFELFPEARCLPRSRGYAKMVLRGLGTDMIRWRLLRPQAAELPKMICT